MPSNTRIVEIEMLRGVAVLPVVITHGHGFLVLGPDPGWTHIIRNYVEFWWGVDLFLAISGFVIARSLLPHIRQAGSSGAFVGVLAVFWTRRAWRILPAAWLWLTISLFLSAFFNHSHIFDTLHHNYLNAIAILVFMANLRYASPIDPSGFLPTTPYWSLSLEEQFYVLLPLVAFFAGRRLALAIGLAAVAMFFIPQSNLQFALRANALLLGVLLAIAAETPVFRALAPSGLRASRLGRTLALWLPVLLMAALSSIGWKIAPFPAGLIAVLSACLVWIAAHNDDLLMADGMTRRLLAWIGSRSYGIYLIHVPAFMILHEILFRNAQWLLTPGPFGTGVRILSGVALLLVLSELTHRFVERPLRLRGRLMADRLAARAASMT